MIGGPPAASAVSILLVDGQSANLEVQDIRLSRQTIALDEVVAEAVAMVAGDAEESRVAMAVGAPSGLGMAGDRQLLGKALVYLLKTGEKFSRPDQPLFTVGKAIAPGGDLGLAPSVAAPRHPPGGDTAPLRGPGRRA